MHKLKRRDIAPPGGFHAEAFTGALFTGSTFSEVAKDLAKHLKANNGLPQDAEDMVDLQTAKRLHDTGHDEWIERM